MDWWNSLLGTVRGGLGKLAGIGENVIAGVAKDALSGLQQVGSSLLNVITNPLSNLTTAVATSIATITGDITEALKTMARWAGWAEQRLIWPLEDRIEAQIARLWAALRAQRWWTLQMIIRYDYLTRMWAFYLVLAEKKARERDFQASEVYTRARVQWALGIVQQEAASGYATGYTDRISLLQRILDDAVTRDPVLKEVVSKVTGILLDLVGVEDPVARWIAGELLSKIADDLGIDKAIGSLAGDLAQDLLGEPKPRNLHDVIMSIAKRLNTLEQQWATFMANGGPEVEQAGDQWRDITSLVTDVGLLGFAAAGIADPAGTASALAEVSRPVGTATISDVAKLLSGRF